LPISSSKAGRLGVDRPARSSRGGLVAALLRAHCTLAVADVRIYRTDLG
jgi:hypothetical protein